MSPHHLSYMASNLVLVHSGQSRGGFVVSEHGSYGGRLSSQCAWVYFPTLSVYANRTDILLTTCSPCSCWYGVFTANNFHSCQNLIQEPDLQIQITLAKMVSHCELGHSSPNNWLLCSEIHLWGRIWSPSHFKYESSCKLGGECYLLQVGNSSNTSLSI